MGTVKMENDHLERKWNGVLHRRNTELTMEPF